MSLILIRTPRLTPLAAATFSWPAPDPALLARSLLAPASSHAPLALLTPRSSPSPVARPTRTSLLASAVRAPPARLSQGRWCWCRMVVVLARRRIPPRWPESTGPSLLLPYVANVCFKCFRCFIGILQLLHIDIAKVDRDAAHVAYFCKCFQCYVANILKKNSDICCNKCFI
jgi:hypothetical protein